MLNAVDRMYLGLLNWMQMLITDFKEDEKGVGPFVATILIIVIVVALCALFWTYISDWFETMWTNITNSAAPIGQSGTN